MGSWLSTASMMQCSLLSSGTVQQESREKKDALLDPEDPHVQTSL